MVSTKQLSSTAFFNIDNNNKYLLNTKYRMINEGSFETED